MAHKEKINADYAAPIVKGVEDKFYYVIGSNCIQCGQCIKKCPVQAIVPGEPYYIEPSLCIDCGTCSYVCPVKAARPV